jgi:hypothetical protein
MSERVCQSVESCQRVAALIAHIWLQESQPNIPNRVATEVIDDTGVRAFDE